MKTTIQALAISLAIFIYSNATAQTSTVTDIDGNVYSTQIYGTMEWMTENLKTTHFANGTAIKYINDSDNIWAQDTVAYFPAYCDYNNLPVNGIIYGHMYNWYAIINKNNVCPDGWHVPDTTEWVALTKEILGNEWKWGTQEFKWTGVVNAGSKMKSDNYWEDSDTPGSNESGFNVLPGGIRRVICGGEEGFHEQTKEAYFWTPLYMHQDSTVGNGRQHVQFMYNSDEMIFSGGRFAHAKSVRCMRYVDPSATEEPTSITETAENIAIFPNPTSQSITIALPKAPAGSHAQVYNSMGVMVLSAQLSGNQTTIDISALPKGAYLCKIYAGSGIAAKRILKQ